MVVAFVDVDVEDFAIRNRVIMKKEERKERFVHVASMITAAMPARTKAIMVAQDTKEQSRRIERFLNWIELF